MQYFLPAYITLSKAEISHQKSFLNDASTYVQCGPKEFSIIEIMCCKYFWHLFTTGNAVLTLHVISAA